MGSWWWWWLLLLLLLLLLRLFLLCQIWDILNVPLRDNPIFISTSGRNIYNMWKNLQWIKIFTIDKNKKIDKMNKWKCNRDPKFIYIKEKI